MKRLVAAALLAAISPAPALAQAQADSADPAPAAAVCPTCGVVTAVKPTALRGEPQWMSTISGAVVGNQPSSAVGAGAGRSLPSTGGSASLPGREADLGPRHRTVYEVVVLMDDQSTRKLHYEHRPALSVGDRVRVSGGQVYLR
jgi:outer membrane lipoprotein SlyB